MWLSRLTYLCLCQSVSPAKVEQRDPPVSAQSVRFGVLEVLEALIWSKKGWILFPRECGLLSNQGTLCHHFLFPVKSKRMGVESSESMRKGDVGVLPGCIQTKYRWLSLCLHLSLSFPAPE